MREKRNACRVLVGKSEEKRPLGRARRGWEDNIKIYIGGTRWGGMNWFIWLRIGTSDQLVNMIMNYQVPQNVEKFFNS
jgi:hypothetical protein